MWYRVELDNTGAILKCEEAGEGAISGRRVRYIEARDRTEACSLAKQWWARQLQACRDSKKRLRERRMSEGRCSECESPAERGRRFCGKHRVIAVEQNRRSHSGKVGPRPIPPSAEERFGRSLSLNAGSVLKEFDARGPVLFRAWLVGLIDARRAKLQPQAEAAE